ncbi:uncharacterized protein AMSG_02087 [Thecamonas trahens ATCC 50062]|uniref:Uncharacterized protein n=1 Tax=Thecamonas trahens ATCC 50062 TaxID=461836 RepID=A0A0L0DV43_THETB|nr:hypothetical protein AMSG_02087 [Thecamonas trahens ATCC 50062]KNC56075.1 hypothetical protein AMSG_02087 [Thecamonas trahens ATCC 50062]|eukprot:XP_013761119.1 hypothetical protein AMSG_02087 [Thecamonas trahens ATCC 50062]
MEGRKAHLLKLFSYTACAAVGTYMVFGLEYRPLPDGSDHVFTRAQSWAKNQLDEFWMLDEERAARAAARAAAAADAASRRAAAAADRLRAASAAARSDTGAAAS